MAAYKNIVNKYADAIDWSKVTLLIGDERCVPLDHEDSNWGQISKILFENERIALSHQLSPQANLGAERGAQLYSQLIRENLTNKNGKLEIDLLWLGVGQDGHTLSLFPNHPALMDDTDIVIAVHNSPKPPSDRITLSLNSVIHAKKIVVFATGANKKEALIQAENEPQSLPIGLLSEKANTAGAEVVWLYDEAARPHFS